MTDELVKVAEDSARGSFFLISGSALATVIMAIGTIIVTNLLGPEKYGEYVLALTAPSLFSLFTDLGINLGVTKFAATLSAKGETGHIRKIVQYSLMLKIVVSATLFAANFIFAEQFATLLGRPELTFYIRIASLSIVFQAIYTIAASAFVGLDKTEYQALTANIQASAKSTLSIALVVVGYGVAGAALGFAASNIVAAVSGTVLLFTMIGNKPTTEGTYKFKTEISELMRYGLPLYISLIFLSLIPIYQNFILGKFVSTTEVGNYKAAANFVTLITILSIPITTALLPAFAKLDSSTKDKVKTFFKLANKYTTALIIPFTVLMILLSNEIVQIIYGPTFQTAPAYLALYSLLYLLVGIGYLTLSCFYNGLGQTAITFRTNTITFTVILFLSPVLATSYGVVGVIIAFLVGNTAGNSYGTYVARKGYGLEFDVLALAKVYLTAAMSAVPTFLLFTVVKTYAIPAVTDFLLNTGLPAILKSAPLPELFNVIICSLAYLFTYITLMAETRAVTGTELQTAYRVTERTPVLRSIARPILSYLQRILREKR